MPRRNVLLILFIVIVGTLLGSVLTLHDRIFLGALHTVEKEALEWTDRDTLLKGALDGMFRTSPYYPYSAYIPPEEEGSYEEELQGAFTGIGICHPSLDGATGELWFTPIFNSPAARAGLRFGDRITAIDGNPIAYPTVPEIMKLLQGPENTTVRLTIRNRESILDAYRGEKSGAEPTREVEIKRGKVQLNIVSGVRRGSDGAWDYVLENEPGIGYVRIDQFTDETGALFLAALSELDKKEIKGLVLDLRGNPGGFLGEAVNVCSPFLPEGAEIVSVRKRNGKVRNRLTAKGGKKYDWALAVLIDEDSASASEITAGALADHKRAVLAGTRSYGKGTVQELYDLPGNMGILRITSASFNRPSGEPIHRTQKMSETDTWGITPSSEMTVPLTAHQREALILFQDLYRSGSPIAESDLEPMTRLLFDRARSSEEKEPESKPEEEKQKAENFGNAPYYDPQLDRAVDALLHDQSSNGESD